jgi:hypothetical protein
MAAEPWKSQCVSDAMARQSICWGYCKLYNKNCTECIGLFDERTFSANPLGLAFSLYCRLSGIIRFPISIGILAGEVLEGHVTIPCRIKVVC